MKLHNLESICPSIMKRKLTQLGAASRVRGQNFADAMKQPSSLRDEVPSADSEEDSSSSDESSVEVESSRAEKKVAVEVDGLQGNEHVSRAERDAQILHERKTRDLAKKNLVPYTNKQRVLVFSSRGVTSRFRHLNEDFRMLLPHSKKENKHDTKKNLYEINDLCEMKNCNNCIFFEARKSKDLYMWVTKSPNGPSAKFHVSNIHTMDELRLTGNCLKGSRPLLSFDKQFDRSPEYKLIKEIFTQAFGTPNGFPKSKPFVDHIINFSVLDGRIWFRHFQITDTTQDRREIKRALKAGEETIKLVEIGPRFVLELVKLFDLGFGGQPLYENPKYVSPNKVRSAMHKAKGDKYARRKSVEKKRTQRKSENRVPKDPLGDVFK